MVDLQPGLLARRLDPGDLRRKRIVDPLGRRDRLERFQFSNRTAPGDAAPKSGRYRAARSPGDPGAGLQPRRQDARDGLRRLHNPASRRRHGRGPTGALRRLHPRHVGLQPRRRDARLGGRPSEPTLRTAPEVPRYPVVLWDLAAGRERELAGHHGGVAQVVFSTDGETLVSAGMDCTARIWDTASGTERARFETPHGVSGVAFSPDGKTLAMAIGSLYDDFSWLGFHNLPSPREQERTHRLPPGQPDPGFISIWDVPTRTLRIPRIADGAAGLRVDFSPDGRHLALCGRGWLIRIADAATGEEQINLTGQSDPVYGLVFSPDGKTLASTGSVRLGTGRRARGLARHWGRYCRSISPRI